METIARGIYGNKAVNDPIYDMHHGNARDFLNKINRVKSTPTNYTIPVYYKTGGLR